MKPPQFPRTKTRTKYYTQQKLQLYESFPSQNLSCCSKAFNFVGLPEQAVDCRQKVQVQSCKNQEHSRGPATENAIELPEAPRIRQGELGLLGEEAVQLGGPLLHLIGVAVSTQTKIS